MRWLVCLCLLQGIGRAADEYAGARAAQAASIETQKASVRIQRARGCKTASDPSFVQTEMSAAPLADFPCDEGLPGANPGYCGRRRRTIGSGPKPGTRRGEDGVGL